MAEEKVIDIDDLLEKNQKAELLRFTTAGSVDDGKSTLIGRLLNDTKAIYEDQLEAVGRDSKRLNREEVDYALLTDGLKSEQEQGITIDVAYRYFSTPRRRFIIADTPGHEQYTRNMATGASTANAAIVLIDARNGVLTQSKRHGFIASLLGIPHVLVVINKMDLVDYKREVYEKIKSDYSNFIARLNFTDIHFIPVSALKGDNVVDRSKKMPWYEGQTLLHFLENVEITGDRNLIDFRFPVQYVNRPNLDFRGFCGTVVSGVVRPGDEITVLPSGKKSRIKSITTKDGEFSHAFPPQSVTLTLQDEIDVSRGDMIAHSHNLPHQSTHIEAMLVWMNEKEFDTKREFLIKHNTRRVRALVDKLNYKINPNNLHRQQTDTLTLNEIGRVSFELMRPLNYDEYDQNRHTGSFILIDTQSNLTMAAGMIIERAQTTRAGTDLQETVSKNIIKESSLLKREQREQFFKQKAQTIWFTGLSGSGKSTISRKLEKALFDSGHAVYILDGDNIRYGLSRDLGFSPADRRENIRRVAETARLLNDAGLLVITAFISPYEADRKRAADIIGSDNFIEVYVETPLQVCESRDPKGLYKKARQGEITDFTGISAPYEKPPAPALTLVTDKYDADQCVAQIMDFLKIDKK